MLTGTDFIFLDFKITMDSNCSNEIKRHLLLGRKAMTKLDYIKKQRHQFAKKCPYNQSYGFSSIHVQMWELDHREVWVPEDWCFQTVVLEEILESPLDCKEIKPFNYKGNQSWISIGKIDAEAPILWPPDVKSWLIGKDPDAGKDWGQEENGVTAWDCWLASLTQWTWVWINSGRQGRTRKPEVLQSTGLQRVATIEWMNNK